MDGFEDVFMLDADGKTHAAGLGLKHLTEGIAVDGKRKRNFKHQHAFVAVLIHADGLEVFDVYLLFGKDAGNHGDDLGPVGTVDSDDEGLGLLGAGEGVRLEGTRRNGEIHVTGFEAEADHALNVFLGDVFRGGYDEYGRELTFQNGLAQFLNVAFFLGQGAGNGIDHAGTVASDDRNDNVIHGRLDAKRVEARREKPCGAMISGNAKRIDGNEENRQAMFGLLRFFKDVKNKDRGAKNISTIIVLIIYYNSGIPRYFK